MRLIDPGTIVVLFGIIIPVTFATVHTQCYTYFMNKDGCVHGAADNRNRCGAAPKVASAVQAIQYPTSASMKRHLGPVLEPRYDTTQPTLRLKHPKKLGRGVCGHYDTRTAGACLWVGTSDPRNLESAGWLNKFKKSNCNKRLYVEKFRVPGVIYIPVVDACDFTPSTVENGCFQIGLTYQAFLDLKPNAAEMAAGQIDKIVWDFDNFQGSHTTQGPV